MADIADLIDDVPGFLTKMFDALARDSIDVSRSELDHVCYRVSTQERYQQLKRGLAEFGELLTESQVGGRAISTYKFHEPLIFRARTIPCVELPSPKEGSPYPEGLEHAEFVIDCPFDEFMRRYPAVVFDRSASAKPVNPDIKIQYDGFSVKFHHKPLEDVIKEEQQQQEM